MVSLVPSNVLTTELSLLCTSPAPGLGALQGSLVVPVTARTQERRVCEFKPLQQERAMLRAQGCGSTEEKQ